MPANTFRRTLVGAAVATALGVMATPAAAAPYRGTFDPYDFSGEYIINVNPLCLAQADGWYANVPGICAATLLSATALVENTDVGAYNGTLEFAASISSNPPLFGLYVVGGQIDSFDTAPLHHISGTPDPSPDEFWIQFISGQFGECYGGSPCYGDLGKGVYLYTGTEFPDPTPVASAQYLGPAVDIGAIPEPGTLSLLLGALGGGWLARRRRRKEEVPDSS